MEAEDDVEGCSAREWRAAHGPVTSWGGDLNCPVPTPVFAVSLVHRWGALAFHPGLDQIQEGVLSSFDAVVEAGELVEDVAAKVGAGRVPSHVLMALAVCCYLHEETVTAVSRVTPGIKHAPYYAYASSVHIHQSACVMSCSSDSTQLTAS
jgi:hypothetical protein